MENPNLSNPGPKLDPESEKMFQEIIEKSARSAEEIEKELEEEINNL